MIYRCENPKSPAFANYGGRGIRVDPRWRRSFVSFLEDVGPRPSRLHSLDRIDVNGNYEPGQRALGHPVRNKPATHGAIDS